MMRVSLRRRNRSLEESESIVLKGEADQQASGLDSAVGVFLEGWRGVLYY